MAADAAIADVTGTATVTGIVIEIVTADAEEAVIGIVTAIETAIVTAIVTAIAIGTVIADGTASATAAASDCSAMMISNLPLSLTTTAAVAAAANETLR